MTCHITIGAYTFQHAEGVEVVSTWKELGDFATIRLPNLAGRMAQVIKGGEEVRIELGYDGENREVFRGYVAKVRPEIPFVVECEDEVYALKRTLVNGGRGKAWRSISLRALLGELLAGREVLLDASIPDVNLSPFRIAQGATVAQVLGQITETYLLCAYFRRGVLYVGLPYLGSQANAPQPRFVMGLNVAAHDLTFNRAEDMKIAAQAVSILPDNRRIEVTVGDEGGERRTLLFRNIGSEAALRQMATEEVARLRYDGYTGSLTGFGLPAVEHSGAVRIENEQYVSRTGSYVVDAVTSTWDDGGFRQTITIGKKA